MMVYTLSLPQEVDYQQLHCTCFSMGDGDVGAEDVVSMGQGMKASVVQGGCCCRRRRRAHDASHGSERGVGTVFWC